MLRSTVALAALLFLPCLAYAQNLAAEAGPWEITGALSGSNNREFSSGGFSVAGSVGYFIVPWFQVSGRDSFTYSDVRNIGMTWQNTARLALDFNIPLDHFLPYAGGNIGYFSTRNQGDSPLAAPEVGLKFLITKNVFIFGQAEYDFFWRNTGNNFSNGQFVYTAGFGLRF